MLRAAGRAGRPRDAARGVGARAAAAAGGAGAGGARGGARRRPAWPGCAGGGGNAGRPLGPPLRGDDLQRAVAAAGAQLAAFAELPVQGFGFLSDRCPPARGPVATAADDLVAPALAALAGTAAGVFDDATRARLRSLIDDRAGMLDGLPSLLAHGDLDGGHIYVDGGGYAGIIDLGEIRGAPPLYDVAHFALHERQLPEPSLAALVEGYRRRGAVPPNHHQLIDLLAVLIGLGRLGDVLGRAGGASAALGAPSSATSSGRRRRETTTAAAGSCARSCRAGSPRSPARTRSSGAKRCRAGGRPTAPAARSPAA